jgi:hypothetical protein
LNHGSSEAKVWPIILVSEHQKGRKRPFVGGVTAKGTPSQTKKSLEEASEKMQKSVCCRKPHGVAWRGRIDDDVARRGAKNHHEEKKKSRRKLPNRNDIESCRKAKRTLITAVRRNSPCRRNDIGSCREPKRKLIDAVRRE